MAQNVLLVWLDEKIGDPNIHHQSNITQLRRIVNVVYPFNDPDVCFKFIEEVKNDKICIIISNFFSEYVLPHIHNKSQVDSVFILSDSQGQLKQSIGSWPKLRGTFQNIPSMLEVLQQTVDTCERNSISYYFVTTQDGVLHKNLDRLSPKFVTNQTLYDIIINMDFEQKHFKDFIDHCRNAFVDNEEKIERIQEFKKEYSKKTPIWWYASNSFVSQIMNRALRLTEADVLIKLGFFIHDLQSQIKELYTQRLTDEQQKNKTMTVYRGQGMSKADFDKMNTTKGGLMFFSTFLFTSKDRNSCIGLAERSLSNPECMGVLFAINIDLMQSTTHFAFISQVCGIPGEDILFSMHAPFRIDNVTSIGNNNRMFRVDLTLVDDSDADFRVIRESIREDSRPNAEGWYRLGTLLLDMGYKNRAQQIFEDLLSQTKDENEKASIYQQLGNIQNDQREYEKAISLYEKALTIRTAKLPENHPDLAECYSGMGVAYEQIGNLSKALTFNEQALRIQSKSLPSTHPDLILTYNNIGNVHYNLGEYAQALASYEKALEIRKQILLSNDLQLAASYICIGSACDQMGEYSNALTAYEKALAIQKQSLPPMHPHLASTLNNIGLTYYNIGEYAKALLSHKEALEIRIKSLPSNHDDLSSTYSNIGNVYHSMGDYTKAIFSHSKALEIRQSSLSATHPSLATSYICIGTVYDQMGEYMNALGFFEKALDVQQKSLAPTHPDLASTYNNIGNAYYNMGESAKALPFYQKTLDIDKKTLPPGHPHLASSYVGIGSVYDQLGDYSRALESYEKALEIQQQSLPSTHPHMAAIYNNIGLVYFNKREFPKALSYYERAVQIGQRALPPNHPNLQRYRGNLDLVKTIL